MTTALEGVSPPLLQAMTNRGYDKLTAVQSAVIDPDLIQADMLVSAQTGSGKTLAFGMAIAPTVLDEDHKAGRAGAPLALVIAPTRELALQVERELTWLYQLTDAVITPCVGGMDPRAERRALERGAHFVVGTPGRLRDHIERGALDLSGLRVTVLDEADEMLDLGFRDDLEFILGTAPESRRTLLFSATVPASIARLAQKFQRDAVRLTTINKEEQHRDIAYQAITVAPKDRENAIVNLLRYHSPETTLVFCSTRAEVNHLVSRFTNRGFAVVAMSGELSQSERNHAMQALRDGRAKICIATDVAARGIDLPNLDLVIHADLPNNPETLLHRSGRTGRAGRKGISALIVPGAARNKAARLLKYAKIEAEWQNAPSAEDITARDEERFIAELETADKPTEAELASAQKMLEQFGPEHVATMLLRANADKLSAPEEIDDVSSQAPPARGDRRDRGDRGDRSDRGRDRPPRERAPRMENGEWFVLSVGRRQNAEPRWLVPMLCKAGGLSKSDIGSIKIGPSETHVEISSNCVDALMQNAGPGGMLEKSIYIKPREGRGDFKSEPKRERDDKPRDRRADDRGHRQDRPAKRDAKKFEGERKPYKKRDDRDDAPRQSRSDRPAQSGKPERTPYKKADSADKPNRKKSDFKKPGFKKDDKKKSGPYKPGKKFGRASVAEKPARGGAGRSKPNRGDQPLKRRKPKD
ncbi:MAG: DEAD/DEAH box helicase [Alphaproteobacteria bacterium]